MGTAVAPVSSTFKARVRTRAARRRPKGSFGPLGPAGQLLRSVRRGVGYEGPVSPLHLGVAIGETARRSSVLGGVSVRLPASTAAEPDAVGPGTAAGGSLRPSCVRRRGSPFYGVALLAAEAVPSSDRSGWRQVPCGHSWRRLQCGTPWTTMPPFPRSRHGGCPVADDTLMAAGAGEGLVSGLSLASPFCSAGLERKQLGATLEARPATGCAQAAYWASYRSCRCGCECGDLEGWTFRSWRRDRICRWWPRLEQLR